MATHSKQKGSKIAKDGFQNEENIIQKFLHWKTDKQTQEWLIIMWYTITEIKKECFLMNFLIMNKL